MLAKPHILSRFLNSLDKFNNFSPEHLRKIRYFSCCGQGITHVTPALRQGNDQTFLLSYKDMRGSRRGQGVRTPPEKSQNYKVP